MVENDHLPQFLDEGKSIRFLVWRCFHAVSGGLIQLIQNLQIFIEKSRDCCAFRKLIRSLWTSKDCKSCRCCTLNIMTRFVDKIRSTSQLGWLTTSKIIRHVHRINCFAGCCPSTVSSRFDLDPLLSHASFFEIRLRKAGLASYSQDCQSCTILLIVEILHRLIGDVSHELEFPRCCRI